ncbi:MAG: ABC transporter permease [Leptospiraceae bacterium]|nr:MAG: ABC transporter permease [Leptospiraceae bacterium]
MKNKKPAILRLKQYILKYKIRILLGIFFALIASLSNLFSLTSFVPIFNAIGSDKKIKVIEIGPEEKKIYEKFKKNLELESYEKLYVKWVEIKIKINQYFEPYDNKQTVYKIILFIIPVYLLKMLSLTASIFFLGTAGFYATRDLRNDLYEKLNRLNLSFFEQERTGYIMSRVVNDVHLISRSISVEFQEAIVNFFYIITHLALLIFISWKMLIIVLIGVPILMTPVNKFALKVKKAAKNQQERLADLLTHLQEIISGIRVIRAFSMEDFEEMRFNLINEKLYKDTFKGHYYHQVGPAITELVVTVVVLLFLSWGAYEITQGELTKGHFFTFFFTLMFIMRPLIQTSVMLNLLGIVGAASERIFEIFDNNNEFQLPENPITFKGLKKSIQYNHVYFTYPTKQKGDYVLNDINIEIKKNQVIALVGESGGGKSTIVDLLMRFYDPIKGEILIDDIDLRQYNIFDIRKKIGIVSQNVFLFNATIKENITLFDDTKTDEEIINVCKLAYAHDFIEKLPHGYNTLVGERGVMLSGGQRQRIAIARALIHNPEIIIFDEATSALDNESEKMVEKAIESAIKDKTVIMIAHRFRTIYKADKIYVIEKGTILEEGTHQELIEKNGYYKKLYELQFS